MTEPGACRPGRRRCLNTSSPACRTDGRSPTKPRRTPWTTSSFRDTGQGTGAAEVRGWTADGKQLDAEALAKRLEKGGPVLLARDGKPLSAAYRALFKDDALILSLPQKSGPGNPPPDRPREPIDK